jgi:hypothetical protein
LLYISETKKNSQTLADKIKVMEENLAGTFVNYWERSIFPCLVYGWVFSEFGKFKNDEKGIYTNGDNR